MKQFFKTEVVITIEGQKKPLDLEKVKKFLQGHLSCTTYGRDDLSHDCEIEVDIKTDKLESVGQLKRYSVPVKWTMEGTVEVWATSPEEAAELSEDEEVPEHGECNSTIEFDDTGEIEEVK